MASIRRGFLTYPNRLEAIERAKYKDTESYICANCSHLFNREDINTDHIEPIGVFKNWEDFINKVFVTTDKLQVLCKECHKEKTREELKVMKKEKQLANRSIFQVIRDEWNDLEKESRILEESCGQENIC